MNPVMRIVWLFFMAKKKLGLTRLGRPARPPAMPTSKQLRGLSIDTKVVGGFPLHVVKSSSPSERVVVYLHGGGYVQPIAKQHWDLIAKIARETSSTVFVPRYGLASRHNVDDALGFLELVRKEVAGLGLPVVIAGDSAGGGLALTIAQQSSWQQITKRLILIAPWVDSEWNYEDIERYENRDPWLLSQSLRYIAIVWSGRGDYKRVEVSPLRGEMRGLPPTSIYVGDYDLLYQDALALKMKLAAAGIENTLHFQPGALHVYPLIPSPEGTAAVRKMLDEINQSE
ncbi:MAG: alpha/beta hydrolase [Actinobacteria bacterium]|nr:alpha/beta hydrolase [Actinomycetota bacterium]